MTLKPLLIMQKNFLNSQVSETDQIWARTLMSEPPGGIVTN